MRPASLNAPHERHANQHDETALAHDHATDASDVDTEVHCDGCHLSMAKTLKSANLPSYYFSTAIRFGNDIAIQPLSAVSAVPEPVPLQTFA